MLTDSQFEQLCHFVHQYLIDSAARCEQGWVKDFPRAAEHRWQHTLNVLRNAEAILAGEGADDDTRDTVRAAVILHDVSLFVCDHAVHGSVSAEIAEQHLREQGYPKTFVLRVARAVAEHGTDLGPLPPAEQEEIFSPEGKIVLEADILDKLGASAVAGELLNLGKRGMMLHECRPAMDGGRAMERARFFKDYVWTPTGRRMAEERFAFFLRFLDQLADEVVEVER